MEINVYFRTYNAYGGHATLTLIGDYLILDAPSFGDAIEEIEVEFHFRSAGPPRKTLESMYDDFHAELAALPTVTFRRKKRKAEVSFCSELLTAREVERSLQLSLDLFVMVADKSLKVSSCFANEFARTMRSISLNSSHGSING